MRFETIWRRSDYRLLMAIGLAVVSAILSTALIHPFIEWYYGLLTIPARHAHLSPVEYLETVWGLAVPALLVFYLLPAFLVDYVGGVGRFGVIGVLAFFLAWLGIGWAAQFHPFLLGLLFFATGMALVFELFAWVYLGRRGGDTESVGFGWHM